VSETIDDPKPEGPRERWNRKWSARGPRPFELPPAAWLAGSRRALVSPHGRRALDVACGDGRNAGYLAKLGFEVDAVDISDVVIEALQIAARRRGLGVTARRMDLETEPLPIGRYDVVVQFNYLQRDLFAPIAAALAPGGVLVTETFTTVDADRLGGQIDARYLLRRGELRRSFPQLRLVRYREGVRDGSGGPRAVASLVAQRPGHSAPRR
jgi:tellurite methyltransferase